MFRRFPVVVALALWVTIWSAGNAGAQEAAAWPAAIAIAPETSTFAGTASPLFSAEQIQRAVPQQISRSAGTSTLMTSLYATTAVMQVLDVHSTLAAFRAGATEANPLMQDVTKNGTAFLAVKVGVAATTIFAARQVSKRNKMAAIATLVAINSAYAIVVNHNYKVARGGK
jgi:Domain of unknown function (DUF5658)